MGGQIGESSLLARARPPAFLRPTADETNDRKRRHAARGRERERDQMQGVDSTKAHLGALSLPAAWDRPLARPPGRPAPSCLASKPTGRSFVSPQVGSRTSSSLLKTRLSEGSSTDRWLCVCVCRRRCFLPPCKTSVRPLHPPGRLVDQPFGRGPAGGTQRQGPSVSLHLPHTFLSSLLPSDDDDDFPLRCNPPARPPLLFAKRGILDQAPWRGGGGGGREGGRD